eukprot:3642253-Amphidinium_carterae.1
MRASWWGVAAVSAKSPICVRYSAQRVLAFISVLDFLPLDCARREDAWNTRKESTHAHETPDFRQVYVQVAQLFPHPSCAGKDHRPVDIGRERHQSREHDR